MRVVVINHVSLDGVMQGPARPDEDPRDGFELGGWAAARGADSALPRAMSARMGHGFSWLLGRRTYDDLLAHWNSVGGPFADGLNAATKYVASSHTDVELDWPNSVLLTGEVSDRVAAMREQPGGNLVVMGSGELIAALLPRGLVDELLLMIHPVVLGSGRRLFGDAGVVRQFELIESTTTPDGVLLAGYQAAPDGADSWR